MRCRVRDGLRGARRIFASRNDRRRGPGAARWQLLTCPGRRPIRRVQVHRVGVASVSSRVRTIITTAVTARRGDRRRAVHTATARTPGRGEASARQNSADATTLVSLLRVTCRARSSCVCRRCVRFFTGTPCKNNIIISYLNKIYKIII